MRNRAPAGYASISKTPNRGLRFTQLLSGDHDSNHTLSMQFVPSGFRPQKIDGSYPGWLASAMVRAGSSKTGTRRQPRVCRLGKCTNSHLPELRASNGTFSGLGGTRKHVAEAAAVVPITLWIIRLRRKNYELAKTRNPQLGFIQLFHGLCVVRPLHGRRRMVG